MDPLIPLAIIEYVRDQLLQGRLVAADLTASSSLIETGLIDSMALVILVNWLEQRFQVQIDPGDIVVEHFNTIETIAILVSKYHGR